MNIKYDLVFTIILAIFFTNCNNSSSNELPFTTYDAYFVKNDIVVDSSGNFLELQDMASFDQVFGAAAAMSQTKWVQAEDFDTHFIVAIIKDFVNNRYGLKINTITLDNNIIKVDYSYNLQEQNLSYSSTGNVIASLKKVPHKGIEFYENGKLINKTGQFK